MASAEGRVKSEEDSVKFKQVVIQQRMAALAAPCELAEQCTNSHYFFAVYPAQGVRCGVVLTVNVGEE